MSLLSMARNAVSAGRGGQETDPLLKPDNATNSLRAETSVATSTSYRAIGLRDASNASGGSAVSRIRSYVGRAIPFKQAKTIATANAFQNGEPMTRSNSSASIRPMLPTSTLAAVKRDIEYRGRQPTLRQTLAFQYDTKRFGRIWEMLDAVLTSLFVALYIWNTSYARRNNVFQPLPPLERHCDLVLAIVILVQFLPRVWLAPSPTKYGVKMLALTTWASTLSVILAYIFSETALGPEVDASYMQAGVLVFFYPSRFLRLHYSVRQLLVPVKNSFIKPSIVVRKILKIVLTIFFTLLTLSALVHITSYKHSIKNNQDPTLTFFDAFFFTTVSSITGMSSNMVTDNLFNKIIVLYVIIAGVVFIPSALFQLFTLMNQRSKYSHRYRKESNKNHVIICGEFEVTSMFEFLREFFCEDHGPETVVSTQVIILSPNEPSEEMSMLLADPTFASPRVQWIKGDATSFRSLEKVKADTAAAAFLLCPKFSAGNLEDLDAEQMMRALSMKKYNRHLKLYAQVHLPSNVPHFDFLAKDVVCISAMNMGLLARSAMVPGFASLMVLLTTSITETNYEYLHRKSRKKDIRWIEEYLHGATQEIYPTIFPAQMKGVSFRNAAQRIYELFGATLFGIGIPKRRGSPTAFGSSLSMHGSDILLSPLDYVINGSEIGFVVSSSSAIANDIAGIDMSEIENNNDAVLGGKLATSIPIQESPAQNKSFLERDPQKRSYASPSAKAELFLDADSDDDGSESSVQDSKEPTRREISSQAYRRHRKAVAEQSIKRAQSDGNGVQDLPSNLSQHILLCSSSSAFPPNIDVFISCVRKAPMAEEKDAAIVILSVVEPTGAMKRTLEKFGNVYFVIGSPMSRYDLYRAGAQTARKTVILSNSKYYADINSSTADASALLTALNVESMSMEDDGFILVECIHRDSFKLIGEADTIRSSDPYSQALVRPSFMAGNVYAPIQIDTLISQCYYNPHILSIVHKLVFGNSQAEGNSDRRTANMYLIRIPERFIGHGYRSLVSYVLEHCEATCLGLYRTVTHKSHPLSFVFLNPLRETLLREQDRLYIIASQSIELE